MNEIFEQNLNTLATEIKVRHKDAVEKFNFYRTNGMPHLAETVSGRIAAYAEVLLLIEVKNKSEQGMCSVTN